MTFMTDNCTTEIMRNGANSSSNLPHEARFHKQRYPQSYDFVNPFVYQCVLPWYRWVKLYFLSFTLLPIRGLLVAISLLVTMLLCSIATSNRTEKDLQKPMSGWRKYIVRPPLLLAARAVFFFGGLQWLSVKGRRASRKDAPILVVAPHSSFMDAFIVVYLGMSSVVGKTETANSTIGCLLKMTQPILVSREDPNSRFTAREEIKRRCAEDADWPQIIIFPEGTCTNRSCLINYKLGAFIPGVPVQPVILTWPNTVDSITWTWKGPGVLHLLWLTLTQFHTYVTLEYLPVYTPSVEEKLNPTLFGRNVRSVMSRALNTTTTDYVYDDCRMMTLAKRYNLYLTMRVTELSKLSRTLRAKCESHETFVSGLEARCYEFLSTYGSNFVNLARFSQFLEEAITVQLEDIFSFFDREESGVIDFREFVVGLLLVTSGEDPNKTLQVALRLFADNSASEGISMDNVKNLLHNVFWLESGQVQTLIESLTQAVGNNRFVSIDDILIWCQSISREKDFLTPYRDFQVELFRCTRRSTTESLGQKEA